MPGRYKKPDSKNLPLLFSSKIHLPVILVGPKDHKIQFINSAAEDLLGCTKELLQGANFLTLFDDRSQRQLKPALDLLCKDHSTHSRTESDLNITRKSKKQVKVSVVLSYWQESKHSVIMVSLHDLTEIKKLQSQRESDMRDMMHLSKLADIGQLSAGIAHELNNPLMVIQGFAEEIADSAERETTVNKELQLNVAQILKAVDRMSKIISKISRFVRNDDFRMVQVDLMEVVQETLNLLKNHFTAHSIEVLVEVYSPIIVRCDPGQIEQILVNILNNAIQALQERPNERKISIGAEVSSQSSKLWVWNNGPEIPDSVKEKIMSPFFTTKKVGTGTGLGLALSFSIMKAHNGNLDFESSANKGTRFYLEFPNVSKIQRLSSMVAGRILVVDDDESSLWLLSNKLRHYGFEPITKLNGEDALDQLRRSRDVVAVFTDYRMSPMDGLELIQKIRNEFGTKHHLFIVTGYPLSMTEERRVRAAGAEGVILKPVDIESFSKIMQIISQRVPEAGKKVSGQ